MSAQKAKKKVFIIGHLVSFAGAGPLAHAFKTREDWEVELVANLPDNLEFSSLYNAHVLRDMNFFARNRLRKSIQDADLTIIAGTPGLDPWMRLLSGKRPKRSFMIDEMAQLAPNFSKHAIEKPVALLVSDSHLLIHPHEINTVMNLFPRMLVFAMPDLIPYIERRDILPFYPGTGAHTVSATRTSREKPLIGHSPSREARFAQKGTQQIIDVLEAHNLDFDLISGLPYKDALYRKSQLDIFVDQIASPTRFPKTDWSGGVGKSGLEAMALGCAVVTSGKLADTQPHMPLPPVLMSNEERFESDLLDLVADPERIAQMGRESKVWYERYATTEAQVRFILERTSV